MIIFNGFNITEENTPKLLWWMPKLSVIRWGFEALCLNEFQGLRFKCDRPHKAMCANTGMDALERINVGLCKSSLKKAVTAEFAILGKCAEVFPLRILIVISRPVNVLIFMMLKLIPSRRSLLPANIEGLVRWRSKVRENGDAGIRVF